jgi:sulfite reductase (NADPH) flavoprotein alpha-component
MSQPIHILYATMTGNAEYCAAAAEKAVRALGFVPQVHNVTDIVPAELARDRWLLICVSTYGEGDPPPDAESFFDRVKDLADGTLAGVGYALLALGDTNYDDFCGFGKKLDFELQRLGAHAFIDRIDADVDYDPGMVRWIDEICAVLQRESAATA